MTSCPDCPDLGEHAVQPARSVCCRDEHIQRRLEGSFDTFPGIEEARRRWDQPKPEPGGPNRQERRAKAAKERKRK